MKKEKAERKNIRLNSFSRRDPVVIAGMNFCRRSTAELTPDMRQALLAGAQVGKAYSMPSGAFSSSRVRRETNQRGTLIALGLATGASLAVLNCLITFLIVF